MNKRLYKSNDNIMINGVCGGIAEYLDMDPTLIRLGWVLFCALGGSGIIAAAALLRIISYSAAAIKYRRFASLHTYMNKLTGFLVFTVPYVIFLPFAQLLCLIISAVAVIAAAEELIIHISAGEYNADAKTLFMLKEKDK